MISTRNGWADALAWTFLFLVLVWLLSLAGCTIFQPRYGSGEIIQTILEPEGKRGEPDLWNQYADGSWKHE